MPREQINPAREWMSGRKTNNLHVHWDREVPLSFSISVETDIEALREIVEAHDRGDFLGEVDSGRVRIFTEGLTRGDMTKLKKTINKVQKKCFPKNRAD